MMNGMRWLLALLVGLSAFSSQATELVLKEGDVVDLGAAPAGQRVFDFDKVRMASHSLILVPMSYRNVDIRINELSTDGVAYLYVYNDILSGRALPPPTMPKADMCNPGEAGRVGNPGHPGGDGPRLTLTTGLAQVARFVLINHGGSGGPGSVGGKGQDGGDSGGANKCLNPCNGGNAGPGGVGGAGGNGGAGGDVVFRYSTGATQVASDTFDDPYDVAFLHSLLGVALRAKQIEGYPRPALGLDILKAALGEVLASESRVMPDTVPKVASMESLTRPGVSFNLSGGSEGAAGVGGDGGKGGDGFSCWIGHDMDTGNNGENRNWMIGPQGRPGLPGKLTNLKLN